MKTILVTIALGAAAMATDAMTPPAMAQAPINLRAIGMQADFTRAQARQQASLTFQQLDINHDGSLKRGEANQVVTQFKASRGTATGGADAGARFERMIAHAFGPAASLTRAQFEAQALARFDAIDLNHDGVLTAAERQQARASRAAQGKSGQ